MSEMKTQLQKQHSFYHAARVQCTCPIWTSQSCLTQTSDAAAACAGDHGSPIGVVHVWNHHEKHTGTIEELVNQPMQTNECNPSIDELAQAGCASSDSTIGNGATRWLGRWL